MHAMTPHAGLGTLGLVIRCSLIALFGYAVVSKLADPVQLLSPFEHGVGMSSGLSGVMFVVTVLALMVCIVLLILRRGGLGFAVSGVFFILGAVYSVFLSQNQNQGGCGCGVSIAADSEHELVIHAYQNAACAVLCLFFGVRARSSAKGVSDE